MNGDSPKPRMGHRVSLWTGLDDDKITPATNAEMCETSSGKCLAYDVGMILVGLECLRHLNLVPYRCSRGKSMSRLVIAHATKCPAEGVPFD